MNILPEDSQVFPIVSFVYLTDKQIGVLSPPLFSLGSLTIGISENGTVPKFRKISWMQYFYSGATAQNIIWFLKIDLENLFFVCSANSQITFYYF